MHTLAVQLAPVLAAEKSKVPFYIAGGLLVVWALDRLARPGHAQTATSRTASQGQRA